MITKEVLAMITTTYATRNRQADLAMPSIRCAQVASLRALPVITGEVSVQGTGVFGHARTAADLTFPGTTAWSPPT
jgi:hypothetical protein